MIDIKLTEAEVEAVLGYLGPIVERWKLGAEEPLARAHDKLDMALLHHEECQIAQRCDKWVQGRQCNNLRLKRSSRCALHARPMVTL